MKLEKGRRKVRVTVMVTPDVWKRAIKAAKSLGLNHSEYVEKALVEALDEQAAFVTVLGNPVLREAFIGAFSSPEVLREMAAVVGRSVGEKELDLFRDVLGRLEGRKE